MSARPPRPPLMRRRDRERRRFLGSAAAATGTAVLAGCDALSRNTTFVDVLQSAQHLSRAVHKAAAPRPAMAQEFDPQDVAPIFRANGTLMPPDADYGTLLEGGFADYRLAVRGLVRQPAEYSLEQLRALPSRTQITRHDCVEGWSCIGRWTGVPLDVLLEAAGPLPQARYVVFRCLDTMDPGMPGDTRYYESIDFDDAFHPQTILAYELNGAPLPVVNGAPLRCRVERQLGYKQAKYIGAIELVESLAGLRGGKGGYWEDEGYEWYAGI